MQYFIVMAIQPMGTFVRALSPIGEELPTAVEGPDGCVGVCFVFSSIEAARAWSPDRSVMRVYSDKPKDDTPSRHLELAERTGRLQAERDEAKDGTP
jgi:hypothetical protein